VWAARLRSSLLVSRVKVGVGVHQVVLLAIAQKMARVVLPQRPLLTFNQFPKVSVTVLLVSGLLDLVESRSVRLLEHALVRAFYERVWSFGIDNLWEYVL